MKIRKYFKLNNNESTTYQNLRDAAKIVLGREVTVQMYMLENKL